MRFLIDNSRQCVKACNKTKYIYEFKDRCFETCPIDTINYNNSDEFYCKLKCPFERPFELVK